MGQHAGKGHLGGGVEHRGRAESGDSRGRHPRAVLGHDRAVPGGGMAAGHELPVSRGLRRPRLLQHRDHLPPPLLQAPLPLAYHPPPGQPRNPQHQHGLRLLLRVPLQVRQRDGVELHHGSLRLPHYIRHRRGQSVCRARGALTLAVGARPHSHHQPLPGGPTRRPLLRHDVVRPRHEHRGLLRIRQRCRVHIWKGHRRPLPARQQTRLHRPRPPALLGRLPDPLPRQVRHGVVRAELLLPLQEQGGAVGGGRGHDAEQRAIASEILQRIFRGSRTCPATPTQRAARDPDGRRGLRRGGPAVVRPGPAAHAPAAALRCPYCTTRATHAFCTAPHRATSSPRIGPAFRRAFALVARTWKPRAYLGSALVLVSAPPGAPRVSMAPMAPGRSRPARSWRTVGGGIS